MAAIIAGRFEQQDRAKKATDELSRQGFPAAQVTMFYSNPPGQHAAYPIAEEQREHAGGN